MTGSMGVAMETATWWPDASISGPRYGRVITLISVPSAARVVCSASPDRPCATSTSDVSAGMRVFSHQVQTLPSDITICTVYGVGSRSWTLPGTGLLHLPARSCTYSAATPWRLRVSSTCSVSRSRVTTQQAAADAATATATATAVSTASRERSGSSR